MRCLWFSLWCACLAISFWGLWGSSWSPRKAESMLKALWGFQNGTSWPTHRNLDLLTCASHTHKGQSLQRPNHAANLLFAISPALHKPWSPLMQLLEVFLFLELLNPLERTGDWNIAIDIAAEDPNFDTALTAQIWQIYFEQAWVKVVRAIRKLDVRPRVRSTGTPYPLLDLGGHM